MAAKSRPRRNPKRRSPRRLVDSLRAAVGSSRATIKRIVPINRIRARAKQQAGVNRNSGRRRLRTVRDRSVVETKRARTQGSSRRTRERQGKPRQVKRRQDGKQQTVRELREQAREAGVEGRWSMTKDQLIKALRGRR